MTIVKLEIELSYAAVVGSGMESESDWSHDGIRIDRDCTEDCGNEEKGA